MTFGEFLSDRLRRIVLQGLALAVSALFLIGTGTQPGVVGLLLLALFLIFTVVQVWDFLKLRSRLEELSAVMSGLDQKYLFAECAPPPKEAFERHMFDLMRRSGRAMIGAVSEAQAAQREYREYIESWVHEIKAPITAAGLICRNAEPRMRRRLMQELGQIEDHVERALFYARAESTEKDILIRQTKLKQIADQAIANHRALLIQSGIRVETENLEQTVYTDEKWAVFILGQLLQNAARYRRKASGDSLPVRDGENPVIRLSAKSLGRLVQLTVSDNGMGIAAHELPRVFDRGFTGSNGRIRGGSTGMGLYLCRRLAGCLEMDVKITSEEGVGTTVILTFPALEADSSVKLKIDDIKFYKTR